VPSAAGGGAFINIYHLKLGGIMSLVIRQGRALLLAVLAVCVSNCGAQGASATALVGHWVYVSGAKDGKPEVLELFKDGTGVVDEMSVTWKVDNKRLALLSQIRGISCDFKVAGYELTLVYNDGDSAVFVKKDKLEEYRKVREQERRRPFEAKIKKAEQDRIQKKKVAEQNLLEMEKKSGYFTDSRDSRKYRTVKIGGKTWMAQNMNYQTSKSLCPGNDNSNCAKYGRLYSWKAATLVCPSGWHLPSRREWNDLATATGGDKAGGALRAMAAWEEKELEDWENEDWDGFSCVGTDDFGFSAMPGGFAIFAGPGIKGGFVATGALGYWWTATEKNGSEAYSRIIGCAPPGMGDMDESESDKDMMGLSVRCVADTKEIAAQPALPQPMQTTQTQPTTVVQNANTFRTVKIDNKIWMAENLNTNVGKSWCYENNQPLCDVCGRLYDWNTAAKACPAGWHLPTRQEWEDLVTVAGGKKAAGKTLKAKKGWNDGGTPKENDGFSAQPCGYRHIDGDFGLAGKEGNWWTATESGRGNAFSRSILYSGDNVNESKNGQDKNFGNSVRCVQD
jgi:uncharacterized protein (TIGR02145 family)